MSKMVLLSFKNNNLSILTSSIFNIKNMDKSKVEEIIKQAEIESNDNEITDQNKYLG